MHETTPEQLLAHHRAVVVAPAGCGKTELIAKSVGLSHNGRQLVLTHTHAGVKSIFSRFKKLGISSSKYRLDTIASFAREYATSFPLISNIPNEQNPLLFDWNAIYQGAFNVLNTKFGKEIIQSSYNGVFVDEYQDCTVNQHLLIKKLAEIIPCRVLGDPLQGIFDFEDSTIVDWSNDVFNFFERLPDLRIPWRWHKTNSKLGDWITNIRHQLESGTSIELCKLPEFLNWLPKTRENQINTCYNFLKKTGTIVAIHKWPNQAHDLARRLNGKYVSMEEVEGQDLIKACYKIETTIGKERALEFIKFASKCLTKVSTELSIICNKLEQNSYEIGRLSKYTEIALSLFKIARTESLEHCISLCASLMEDIEKIPKAKLFRPELWSDMKRVLKEHRNFNEPLHITAKKIRDLSRKIGRQHGRAIVSRVLLIKGLEFDHAILADADALTNKELYVALTRAKSSLAILSDNNKITVRELN